MAAGTTKTNASRADLTSLRGARGDRSSLQEDALMSFPITVSTNFAYNSCLAIANVVNSWVIKGNPANPGAGVPWVHQRTAFNDLQSKSYFCDIYIIAFGRSPCRSLPLTP